jgi:hypothetical protein
MENKEKVSIFEQMEDRQHTLYEWCFLNKVNPTSTEFDKDDFIGEDFMTRKISIEEFKEFMNLGKYEENSIPRKPIEYLELRMYGLVPYNISEIQKGIQFNHANDNYSVEYANDVDYLTFRREWKTNIILNGGTSNEGHAVRQGFRNERYYGTMQKYLTELKDHDIKVATFYEPDLNSMLSAICFLVDERVFNKELYPDFVSEELPVEAKAEFNPDFKSQIEAFNKWSRKNDTQYSNWVDKIGGSKNEFLRTFLANKRLA